MANRDRIVGEEIARAQDMLGRLGQRSVYEPNYTREKLWAASKSCAHALGALGEDPDSLMEMVGAAVEVYRP
jgi:hypothetical protein